MASLFRGKRLLGLTISLAGAVVLTGSALLTSGNAQQIYRDPFESETNSWTKGPADVVFVEKEHTRTNRGPFDGQRCEYIHLEAQQGSFIHYHYVTHPAPISEELNIGAYVKANRPGVQILARVVLPHERDPKTLQDRLTAYIRGDTYRLEGRWQKLRISQPVVLAQRQQQLMQKELGRAVNFKDAYVDLVILNVYGGPGRNEVWIDDLEIGPIVAAGANAMRKKKDQPPGAAAGREPSRPVRAATVAFSGQQLLVNGRRFFIRGIRHSGAPLDTLRTAGFNTLWLSPAADPVTMRDAADLGFWLVPTLAVTSGKQQLVARNALGQEVAQFPEPNAVLFWDFGTALPMENATLVARAAQMVRSVDSGRPVSADVWDGFGPYSRNLDLVGAHRWPLMTDLELTGYRDWLNQRRLLANPGTFMWTWVQNHTPDFFTQLLYDQPSDREFKVPVGPQPAQVRLMAYAAIGAGYRGIAFWSDAFLNDAHFGRDRLQDLALLNTELEMLEPLLVTIDSEPKWIETSDKDVHAAVFRTAKGILVLPMWLGKGAQFVPGQAATTKLKILVPQVYPGTQAWEVTPGEVRGLKAERRPFGTEVVVPDFGLTTAIVFTSDLNLLKRLQDHCKSCRKKAAERMYHQAEQEISKVRFVQQQLERQGKALPQTAQLLNQAEGRLQAAQTYWKSGLYGDAYRESQRALRPVRVLMRAQWEKAAKGLDSPVSLPYAVSYYTLPRFWEEAAEVASSSPGANVLPGGDFEVSPGERQAGWVPQPVKVDEVAVRVERVGPATPSSTGAKVDVKSGRLCAMLQIEPQKKDAPFGALERTFLALHSPQVHVQPGTMVRISGWVHIPEPIKASVDGALFYDTIGGEPLAIRLTDKTPWKKIHLYRRVPASGTVGVTLALSGLGTVYFDDIRIEPLLPDAQRKQ